MRAVAAASFDHGSRSCRPPPSSDRAGRDAARAAAPASCARHRSRRREPRRTARRRPWPCRRRIPSSPGWKMRYTVPSKSRVSCQIPTGGEQHGRVAVMAAAVHAALVDGTRARMSFSSCIGSASMSARRPTRGRCRRGRAPPRRCRSCHAGVVLDAPARRARSYTPAPVRCSSKPSSGCACRSRRTGSARRASGGCRHWVS